MKSEPDTCGLFLGSARWCRRPHGHDGRHCSEPDINGLWRYLDDVAKANKEAR